MAPSSVWCKAAQLDASAARIWVCPGSLVPEPVPEPLAASSGRQGGVRLESQRLFVSTVGRGTPARDVGRQRPPHPPGDSSPGTAVTQQPFLFPAPLQPYRALLGTTFTRGNPPER